MNKELKNVIESVIVSLIIKLSYAGLGLWMLIEFILHLIKEQPFNWLSVQVSVSLWTFHIGVVIFLIFINYKRAKKLHIADREEVTKPYKSTKSKFQTKLEQKANQSNIDLVVPKLDSCMAKSLEQTEISDYMSWNYNSIKVEYINYVTLVFYKNETEYKRVGVINMYNFNQAVEEALELGKKG